jgi:hypothetical protein
VAGTVNDATGAAVSGAEIVHHRLNLLFHRYGLPSAHVATYHLPSGKCKGISSPQKPPELRAA